MIFHVVLPSIGIGMSMESCNPDCRVKSIMTSSNASATTRAEDNVVGSAIRIPPMDAHGSCKWPQPPTGSKSDHAALPTAMVTTAVISHSVPSERVALLAAPSLQARTASRLAKVSTSLRHQLYVAWVLFFFAGSSLGAIFINKTCLTGYHFRFPLTLVLGQMLFAITLLSILHTLGYHTLPLAHAENLRTLAIPTVLFTANVVVGLSALSLVNIPMFSAFRRLTLLFVMVAEYLYLGKTHSRAIVRTVVVMTTGAFISAIDDVTFSRLGYCLVFVNNLLTAGYLASIKRAMKDTTFDPLALLYYTALLGFPLVATLLICTGELGHVVVAFRTQPELLSWRFLVSLVLTATGAFAVNFSTSLCTHVTSPLTTSVAGQVKNVLQTVLGFFSWGFVPTFLNTIGLLIALGAQIWFAYLKYLEQVENTCPHRLSTASTVESS